MISLDDARRTYEYDGPTVPNLVLLTPSSFDDQIGLIPGNGYGMGCAAFDQYEALYAQLLRRPIPAQQDGHAPLPLLMSTKVAVGVPIATVTPLALTAMERALNERAQQTPFCFGDQPGLADICLAGHVAGCQNSDTPFEGFLQAIEMNARCHHLPAFKDNHRWVVRDQGAAG